MLQWSELKSAIRAEGGISRRLFASYAAALCSLPVWNRRCLGQATEKSWSNNPFTLGVASGDPDDQSVVLWTKLAPRPEEPDGGVGRELYDVRWEVAEDEQFRQRVSHGVARATPSLGHSVHVVVHGLQPNRWYWYRFHSGDATSPIGRTRTLPEPGASPETLKFAFASCQHYEQGLYTAYAHMAQDHPDLMFHLGDYIYEGPGQENRVRRHSGAQRILTTLADYRLRHMQYRSDPLLQAMHAQCPWFVTWDDHEFENNYANDIQEERKTGQLDPAQFLIKRAAAYQAYYEMMPLRPQSLPKGPDMRLYRRADYGQLARFLVLDTRQYRTDQPNGDGIKPLNEEALRPSNTLLGRQQRGWLQSQLITTQATWNVLAQQVMMALVQRAPDLYAMDQWPGAAHERMALVEFLATRNIPNPIVLTGDIHSNWANELRVDDRQPELPVVATEFVGTSISSGGNGSAQVNNLEQLLASNPCVRFHNRQRGYVRCLVTPHTWRSDYVVVDDVTRPGGKAHIAASFVVEAGDPHLKPA